MAELYLDMLMAPSGVTLAYSRRKCGRMGAKVKEGERIAKE